MAPIPAFSLGYRPALDGLRAVSILAVLSRHSGWLSGGYLGVDVFFALSGFLITALLTEEYGLTGMIKLRLFYARRALRLLPALAVCVLICEIVLLATLPPEFGPLALQQGAASCSTSPTGRRYGAYRWACSVTHGHSPSKSSSISSGRSS
ncbi:MAG: acyltransferase [Chloroflexi bacterium]|nr:MAG: acyltransferase [Chloroflexota bacterium]